MPLAGLFIAGSAALAFGALAVLFCLATSKA
jgi:hypothetical protein